MFELINISLLSFSVIDCGRPEISFGVKLLTDTFTVHSEIEFKCESGHKMIGGDKKLICSVDGKWDGKPPTCKCKS